MNKPYAPQKFAYCQECGKRLQHGQVHYVARPYLTGSFCGKCSHAALKASIRKG